MIPYAPEIQFIPAMDKKWLDGAPFEIVKNEYQGTILKIKVAYLGSRPARFFVLGDSSSRGATARLYFYRIDDKDEGTDKIEQEFALDLKDPLYCGKVVEIIKREEYLFKQALFVKRTGDAPSPYVPSRSVQIYDYVTRSRPIHDFLL
jgi:hypothetical protein